MSADVLVLAGIVTVKDTVEFLSLPKSSTQTAPFAPALYIKAPRAVICPLHDGEEKDTYTILPDGVV
jgi:hypothetical protein